MDRGIRAARTFEDGIVVQTYAGGRYDVLVVGRAYPYSKIEANRSVKNIQNGDKVRLCISGRLVEIIGRDGANNVNSSVLPLGADGEREILFGFWSIPEGQPRISNGVIPQPRFDLLNSVTTLATLPRTLDSTSVNYANTYNSLDQMGLLSFRTVTGSKVLSALHRIYSTSSVIDSTSLQVVEVDEFGTPIATFDLPIPVLGAGGLDRHNRNTGVFFYAEFGEQIIYTIAIEGNIISFDRTNPANIVISQMRSLPNTYSTFRDGSYNLAGRYLADSRYTGWEKDSAHGDFGNPKLGFYLQNDFLQWIPLSWVEPRSFIPTNRGELLQIFPVGLCSPEGSEDDQEHVWAMVGDGNEFSVYDFPAGDPVTIISATINSTPITCTFAGGQITLDPPPLYGEQVIVTYKHFFPSDSELPLDGNLISSRWPLLAYKDIREWWWYMASRCADSSFFQVLATDANTGTSLVVWTDTEDAWSGAETVPGIVASQAAALSAAATASRAPGATETLWHFIGVGELVPKYASCAEPGSDPINFNDSSGLFDYLRGYFADGSATNLPPTEQAKLAQPQPDLIHYDVLNMPNWAQLEEGTAKKYVSSRQVASGCHDKDGNYYLIYTKSCYYARGAYLATSPLGYEVIENRGGTYTLYYNIGNPIPETRFTGFYGPGIDPDDIGCIDPPEYYVKVYAEHFDLLRSFDYFWRTWLVSIDRNKRLRYKKDISHYYNGVAGDDLNNVPLHAGTWAWAPVSRYLAVVRDDHWDRSGSTLNSYDAEPVAELLDSTNGNLVARRNLHPSSDGARGYVPSAQHRPTMLIQESGSGTSVTIWTQWNDKTDESDPALCGHCCHQLSIPSLDILSEHWSVGLKPTNFPSCSESRNAVHYNNRLAWIDDNNAIKSR